MTLPSDTIDLARALALPGWMAECELRWLAEHAQTCARIIEAGCWQGRSTRALADHCAGRIVAVDPWAGDYFTDRGHRHTIRTDVYDQFAAHLADHVASGRVVPIQMPFVEAAPSLHAVLGGAADLVFLDGDHRYEAVLADIDAALPLLRPGGILAGHDYSHPSWPGVKRAVDERYPQAEICRSIWWVTV